MYTLFLFFLIIAVIFFLANKLGYVTGDKPRTVAIVAGAIALLIAGLTLVWPINRPASSPSEDQLAGSAFSRHIREAQDFLATSRYDEALSSLQQAQTLTTGQDELGQVASLIGDVYADQNRYDEAKYHYTEALLFALDSNDPVLIINTFLRLGDTVRAMGEPNEAHSYYRQAQDFLEMMPDTYPDKAELSEAIDKRLKALAENHRER